MKFIILKYPNPTKFQEFSPKKRNSNLSLKNTQQFFPKTLPKIINELNKSHILNLQPIGNTQIIAEVQIIFEDFDFNGKLKNEDNLENSIAHYNHSTKSIHIFQKIIEPKFTNEIYKTSYETLINSISNPNFLLNFFVLHEIGHAIHLKTLALPNSLFNNLTDYFTKTSNNEICNEQNLLLHENFADMFASIALLQIDKNNTNLIKDLSSFSEFRENISSQEKYFTFENLNTIIKDYENNKLNIPTFNDMVNYINLHTNEKIKKRLNDSLSNIPNSQDHNQHLGFLSKIFKLSDTSFNGIVKFLEKEISYKQPNSVIFEHDSFEVGKSLPQNSFLAKIKNRISNCSLAFRNEQNFTPKFKN